MRLRRIHVTQRYHLHARASTNALQVILPLPAISNSSQPQLAIKILPPPSRLRLSLLTLLTLLQISLAQTAARAQEDNHPPKGFKALFNGHDFDNWVGGLGDDLKKVAAMPEADRAARQKKLNDGIHQHWRVED